MIRVSLTRGRSHAGIGLELPATPADIGEAFSRLDMIDATSQTVVRAITPDIPMLRKHFMQVNWDNDAEVSKINALTKQMEKMTVKEQSIFYSVLSNYLQATPDKMLEIAEKAAEFQLLREAGTPEELGKCLVTYGHLDFPENVRPYLDYGRLGREQHEKLKGSFTEHGYILPKAALAPKKENNFVVFTLHLESNNDRVILRLPAEEETMFGTLAHLGIEEFAQARINKVEVNLPYLIGNIPTECPCVEDANELALGIEGMLQADGELLKFLSVLEVVQAQTMSEALRHAHVLYDYERVPDNTAEYGKKVLQRLGANRDVMQALDGNTNFSAIGEFYMQEDGVRRTEFGLVRRCSEPFPEEAPGMVMGGM